MSRVKKIIQQFYLLVTFFRFNWGKSYLATLVKSQNCTKCLEILLLLYNLHILASDRATFVTKSNFGQIKRNLLENLEQPVESPRGGPRVYSGWGKGYFSLAPVPLPKPSPTSRFDAHPHARLGTFETKTATHKGLLPGVGYRISIPKVLREKRGLWNDYHWARENKSILSCYQQVHRKFKSLSKILLYNLRVYSESSLCDVLTSYVVKNNPEVQKSLFLLNFILHLWSVAFEVSLRALLFN